MAYGWAADLEAGLGVRALSEMDRGRERQLRETVEGLYWDTDKRMFADTPRKQQFSQHTNTLAVLADVVNVDRARDLMLRTLTAPGLAQTGLFFRFYLHRALAKAGEGDRYLDQLGDWRDMLSRGLTTFAEIVDRPGSPSRSDCHAWSASPNIEIFRTVLGVDSAAPGFRRVAIAPHPGKLTSLSGSVPHPKGEVEVRLERKGASFEAIVTLPQGVTGEFRWKTMNVEIASGVTRFSLPV